MSCHGTRTTLRRGFAVVEFMGAAHGVWGHRVWVVGRGYGAVMMPSQSGREVLSVSRCVREKEVDHINVSRKHAPGMIRAVYEVMLLGLIPAGRELEKPKMLANVFFMLESQVHSTSHSRARNSDPFRLHHTFPRASCIFLHELRHFLSLQCSSRPWITLQQYAGKELPEYG